MTGETREGGAEGLRHDVPRSAATVDLGSAHLAARSVPDEFYA
jgi:hypothetical protein